MHDTLDEIVHLLPPKTDRRFIPRYQLRMVRDGEQPTQPLQMKNPKDVARQISVYLDGAIQEQTVVVLMSIDNEMLGILPISSGNLHQAVVDAGDVLTPVINGRAPCFIFGHNHPSGNPLPSKEDLLTFKHLKTASQIMHRTLLDCVIVGNEGRYYSWAEQEPYELAKSGLRR